MGETDTVGQLVQYEVNGGETNCFDDEDYRREHEDVEAGRGKLEFEEGNGTNTCQVLWLKGQLKYAGLPHHYG